MIIVACSIYWLYTGQVWEDFLITFRQSQNFADGHGLTYHTGTRVHSFTSPVNVLLPALAAKVLGTADYLRPLAVYTLVSVGCFAIAAAYTVQRISLLSEMTAGALVWATMLACSLKITGFAVNGQEAGFWCLFLSLAYCSQLSSSPQRWRTMGLAWGGLMWTRPDSPLHISLLTLAALITRRGSIRSEATVLMKSAAVCTAAYLPWFVWAWSYYGSPIPHTIIAKQGAYQGIIARSINWQDIARLPIRWLAAPFTPIYATHGWPLWYNVAMAVSGFSALLIGVLNRDRIIRSAGIMFAGSLAYLIWMDVVDRVFPWYYPPCSYFGSLLLAILLIKAVSRLKPWGNIATCAILLVFVYGSINGMRVAAVQQEIVENGIRRAIGEHLKARLKPGDRVYLEPVGYVGYFSGATIIDFPGLVSPEVVRLRKEHAADFSTLPSLLHPEWIVARDWEVLQIMHHYDLTADYELDAVFDRKDEIASMTLVGKQYPMTDGAYAVLRRNHRIAAPLSD